MGNRRRVPYPIFGKLANSEPVADRLVDAGKFRFRAEVAVFGSPGGDHQRTFLSRPAQRLEPEFSHGYTKKRLIRILAFSPLMDIGKVIAVFGEELAQAIKEARCFGAFSKEENAAVHLDNIRD